MPTTDHNHDGDPLSRKAIALLVIGLVIVPILAATYGYWAGPS